MLFEDDGESWGYQQGNALWLNWEMQCDDEEIRLTFATRGHYVSAWKTVQITLPEQEQRRLIIDGVESNEWSVSRQ